MRSAVFLMFFLSVFTASNAQQQRSDLESGLRRFLDKFTEARLLDVERARFVSENSASPSVKEFASLMVKDNQEMLEVLNRIANDKGEKVPTKIGDDDQKSLTELIARKGRDLDKRFLASVKSQRKTDMRDLKAGVDSQQDEIAAFAQQYLPMVESHLAKVKQLQKIRKSK